LRLRSVRVPGEARSQNRRIGSGVKGIGQCVKFE
jgi:hypothetical protein